MSSNHPSSWFQLGTLRVATLYRWQKFTEKGRTRNYRLEREQAAKRKYGPNAKLDSRRKK